MRDVKSVQIDTLLGRIPLFGGLSCDETLEVGKACQTLHLEKNDMLFHPECARSADRDVHGQVKVAFSSPQGTEKVVTILGAGQSSDRPSLFWISPTGLMRKHWMTRWCYRSRKRQFLILSPAIRLHPYR